jgi:DNA-binding transcriptional LysR family regulator
MQLTPVDLQILVRLSEGMTQTQIASDLGIEQPAVSKTIHAAELRVGLPLLLPGRRSRLTSVGHEVARVGVHALRQLQGVDDLVTSLRAGHSNYTRIITSNTPGTYLVPQVMARFLQRHTDAHFELDVVPMPDLWQSFVSGGYDLAIAPRIPFDERVVVAEPVYVDPVVVFTAPSHPLAQRADVGFEDLVDQTVVGRFAEAYWGQVHYELRQRGIVWSHEVDLNSPEAVKRIVASGFGVGILFASSIAGELASGALVSMNIAEPKLEQTYFLVRPKTAATPAVEGFCDFLRSEWCQAARP